VILRACDLARARVFYEETLGLRIYREYGAGGDVSGVVYFLGGGFLEVTQSERGEPARNVILWIQVPDVVVEANRLEAAGVTILKPAGRMPWGLVELWIEDPDGVELRIIEVPDDHPLRRRVT